MRLALKVRAQMPKPVDMRVRGKAGLGAAMVIAAISAAPAQADTSVSSNWAGYAVQRAGTRYNRVVGAWRQPGATCVRGGETYSAMWVGLGGYRPRAPALEQIGTEVDCTASGQVSSSAWYELVPSPSHGLALPVRPGDAMVASVSVSGHLVVMSLSDVTRHRTVMVRVHAAAVDTSSAEWILEAPSECQSASSCQTLPLTDFGRASFALAAARTTRGHVGAIVDPSWTATQIRLTPGGSATRFAAYEGTGPAVGIATPTVLSPAGNAFSVDFGTVSLGGRLAAVRATAARAGRLVHPLR